MEENTENRHAQWIFPNVSRITEATKRKMMAEAMRAVLKTLMETHTYDFANVIRRQTKGGAIGMELTGIVAQIFKEFTKKLQNINIQLKLHERYVDDTNLVTKQTEVGVRYNGQQLNKQRSKT